MSNFLKRPIIIEELIIRGRGDRMNRCLGSRECINLSNFNNWDLN